MHMLGEPRTMQQDPRYDDVVDDVRAFLEERLAAAVAAGIAEERVQLDPGIGFGKTLEHNLELLRRLDELAAIGRPIVVGHEPQELPRPHHGARRDRARPRDGGDHVIAYERGARVFRVHDVAATADALAVAAATFAPWPDPDEDYDDEDDLTDDEDDDDGPEIGVTVEIVGLSLYTHHGVSAAEREIGQRLVLDVRFDVGEPDALITDRVEDTIDYGEVCQVDRPARPAALLQDARAPVLGDRRAPRLPVRGPDGDGQGVQAGAADPAPGRGGLGRGLREEREDRD